MFPGTTAGLSQVIEPCRGGRGETLSPLMLYHTGHGTENRWRGGRAHTAPEGCWPKPQCLMLIGCTTIAMTTEKTSPQGKDFVLKSTVVGVFVTIVV